MVEAYGDRIMEHPVGTGAVPARRSGGAARASCSSATRTTASEFYDEEAPADDAARAGRGAARCKGRRLPMVDRVEVAIIEEHAAALAGVPERRARTCIEQVPDDFTDTRDPEQQARAEPAPSAASTMVRYPRADVVDVVLRHGEPGGRRLHAREGGAAPRDRAGASTSSEEIRLVRRGQAIPAQSPIGPEAWRLRPGVHERDERVRPRPRARRCSTCTATSTATATAGATSPTARRWCSSTRPSPTSSAASSIEQWKKNMDAIGIRIVLQDRASGPRT